MAVELEAKIKVDDHVLVRKRLEDVGAAQVGRVFESNHIYDRKDGAFKRMGSALRVRACRVLEGVLPVGTVTYKGPQTQSALKQREEIEFRIDDPGAARGLLEALGFVESLMFEKRRETWRHGKCTIELDEVPHLGCYVEIEGPDEASIRAVQKALGLDRTASIRESYIGLLVRHCTQNHLRTDRITFT